MQQPLDKAEYLFIEKVLSGSRILCKDEMSGLLLHLALNTDNPKQAKTRQKRTADTYREPEQGEPLLKIFSDLTATIENHQVIQIYGENIRTEYRKIIPCEIQYRDVKLYLSALSADDLRDILIPLQEIESFSIIREQRTNEKIQVQRTIRS
jgi:hypothetical protein